MSMLGRCAAVALIVALAGCARQVPDDQVCASY